MRLIFARRRTLGSVLIRWFTWSAWSHVAVTFDGGHTIIDATLKHGGVRVHGWREFDAEYPERQIVDLQLPDEEAAHRWLLAQRGKPYDWSALVGLVLRSRRWADPRAWFCSELVAAAIAAGGLPLFREDAARITPRDLAVINLPQLRLSGVSSSTS